MSSPNDDPHPPRYLPLLRALVDTYFAFLGRDSAAIRTQGLTPSQFDVVATLGNTPGMTCGELSRRTLVTKGTLTGVLDRLEAKRLLERVRSRADRRSIFVRLTPRGDALFARAFPAVTAALAPYFERLGPGEASTLRRLLTKLKESFEKPTGTVPASPRRARKKEDER